MKTPHEAIPAPGAGLAAFERRSDPLSRHVLDPKYSDQLASTLLFYARMTTSVHEQGPRRIGRPSYLVPRPL